MIYLGYSCKYLAFTTYFSTKHKAVDIPRKVTVGNKKMTNEYSYMAYEGKIAKNAKASDYGWYVEYEVKDGKDTYLIASGHFDTKSPLTVGKTYPRGTVINKIGHLGADSTGYHDHFRVTKNGVRVNPLDYCYAYSDWNVQGTKETKKLKWYTPEKKSEVKVDPNEEKIKQLESTIDELNNKIKEQDNQILSLKAQISEKEAQIEELNNKVDNSTCNHKLLYIATKSGKYKLQLYKNESLYIESNK